MKIKKLLLGVTCVLSIFLLTGCVKKTVITTEQFKSKTEEHNLITKDIISQYTQYNNIIKEATLAIKDDEWQIEFYVITNATEAKDMFTNNVNKIEAETTSTEIKTKVNMLNYNTYSQTTATKYVYISRVENTILYIEVKADQKDEVMTVVEALGY